MNSYVTTNIRLPEDDYLRLKEEAAKSRKSLSAVIREKIGVKKSIEKSPEEIIERIRAHAADNSNNLTSVNIVETLREMRYQNKW
jgi:predicted CopG family antitoxin